MAACGLRVTAYAETLHISVEHVACPGQIRMADPIPLQFKQAMSSNLKDYHSHSGLNIDFSLGSPPSSNTVSCEYWPYT